MQPENSFNINCIESIGQRWAHNSAVRVWDCSNYKLSQGRWFKSGCALLCFGDPDDGIHTINSDMNHFNLYNGSRHIAQLLRGTTRLQLPSITTIE